MNWLDRVLGHLGLMRSVRHVSVLSENQNYLDRARADFSRQMRAREKKEAEILDPLVKKLTCLEVVNEPGNFRLRVCVYFEAAMFRYCLAWGDPNGPMAEIAASVSRNVHRELRTMNICSLGRHMTNSPKGERYGNGKGS